MTSYTVSKETLKINPKPSMIELTQGVTKDKSDKVMTDSIRLLDYASLFTLGFNLDEPQYADRLHRMIKLDPNIDDDDEVASDTDDLPPLEEAEGDAEDAPKMEEVEGAAVDAPKLEGVEGAADEASKMAAAELRHH